MAKKKAPPVKKTGAKHGKHSIRRYLLAGLMVALIAAWSVTYIPEEYVPESLNGAYSTLLASRNTVIARSGIPVSRFDDSVTVKPGGGTPPVRIYFSPSPKIEPGLCEFIASAKSDLDVCIYDLGLPGVAQALVNAKHRGVNVRVATESDNRHERPLLTLQKNGITVAPDTKPSLMHNKFAVADGRRVWTGSYNFTSNGTLRDDNNAIVIDSPEIASCYRDKFDEYMQGRFGRDAKLRTMNGSVQMGSVPLQAAFSPSDKISNLILEHLKTAKKSVRVLAFSFTSEKIANELLELAKQGVSVKCLFDGGQAQNRYSRDEYLSGCGIQVKISPNHRGKMHHKVIIIDGDTVITGSYNFSSNAEKSNDENVLILKNAEIAAVYNREFERCWKGTKGY